MAVGERQAGQDAALGVLLQVLEDLDGIVGIEVHQDAGQVLRTQLLDHVLPDGRLKVAEDFRVDVRAQNLDQELPLLAHADFQDVGDVGGVQRRQLRLDLGYVGLVQGRAHRVDGLIGQAGVLGIGRRLLALLLRGFL